MLNQFQKRCKPEYSHKKARGLHGLYLHYCYLLGYFPKHQKQNSNKVHYLLREDLMRLNQLTAQVTLLGQHNIQTEKELKAYLKSVEERIVTLEEERTKLRNDLRKTGCTEKEALEIKTEIAKRTKELSVLRKEVKLCLDIEARSKGIREKVEQVMSEEEKENGKEKKAHEQQR